MTHIRIHEPLRGDWQLAEHVTEPRPSCIGLPRKYGPPPEDLTTLEPTHYRGVKRRIMADRTKYEVYVRHNGKTQYVGVRDTAVEAARLYDEYVTAWGLGKPLNYPDAGNPTLEEAS